MPETQAQPAISRYPVPTLAEMPEDIRSMIHPIKQIVEAFNVPILEVPGFEADDVIGTLAIQAEKAGYQVYMVTPDKDYGQLVSDNIKIFKPPYQGGDFEIIGPKEVCEKWNIKIQGLTFFLSAYIYHGYQFTFFVSANHFCMAFSNVSSADNGKFYF